MYEVSYSIAKPVWKWEYIKIDRESEPFPYIVKETNIEHNLTKKTETTRQTYDFLRGRINNIDQTLKNELLLSTNTFEWFSEFRICHLRNLR